MKEMFGLCEGRAVLWRLEGRAWIAHTTITYVSGRWKTLLDASCYPVDSRLVTIDEQGMLLVCYQVS